MTRLATDYTRDMASTGHILGEHHVAGSKAANRTIADFDLDLAGKRNDILTPRRNVEIAQIGRRRATKNDSMRRLELGSFETSVQVEFNINFFEMGFVICSGVKSDDLHQLACKRINREKQGDVIGEVNKRVEEKIPRFTRNGWARLLNKVKDLDS